eukprot:105347_1
MLFIYSLIIAVSHSQWITVDNAPLPRHTGAMAAGTFNDSIFVLGGNEYGYQLLEYRNDIWIDHGENALMSWVSGWSDYYTQIANTLYIAHNSNIHTYHMGTNIFISKWETIPNTPDSACLTSTDNILFVIATNTVEILMLDTMQWLQNVPNTRVPGRRGHSCNFDPITSSLYAIGGQYYSNGSIPLSSVETFKFNVENINDQSWQILDDTLTDPVFYVRSIWVDKIIYIIGGYNHDIGGIDKVHIINPITQTISLLPDRLPNRFSLNALAANKNVIFVFYNAEYWFMNVIPTSSPTNSPSQMPTTPTYSPTNSPSTRPTYSPINSPSAMPTTPTYSPTMHPTKVYIKTKSDSVLLILGTIISVATVAGLGMCILIYCRMSKTNKQTKNAVNDSISNSVNNNKIEMKEVSGLSNVPKNNEHSKEGHGNDIFNGHSKEGHGNDIFNGHSKEGHG